MMPASYYVKYINSIHLIQFSLPAEFTVKQYEAERKMKGKSKYLSFKAIERSRSIKRSRIEKFTIPVPEKSRGIYTYYGLLANDNKPCKLVDYHEYKRNRIYATLANNVYNNGKPLHEGEIDIEEFNVERYYYVFDKQWAEKKLNKIKENTKRSIENSKKAAEKAQRRYEDFQMLAKALG